MRVGVSLPTYGVTASPDTIRDTARMAEDLGFDSVWVPDHVMIARDEPPKYNRIFESLSTLCWVAGLTERVRIGTAVIVLPQRNAVVLAKQLATLDQLSNGRLIVGIGPGWSQAEFANLDIPFERRGARTDEAIDVMRSLWATPDEPFAGETYRFENHSFAPGPVQPGGPPLWIGGGSDAALKRAARRGDGWHGPPGMADPARFAEAAARIRELADGRPVELTLMVRIADRTGDVPNPGHAGSGFTTYAVGGSADEVTTHLSELERLGCSHVNASFYHGDIDEMRERLLAFARDVLPALRDCGAAGSTTNHSRTER